MGLLNFFKTKKTIEITKEERMQFTNDMQANAEMLVKQFVNIVNLDFSVESLEPLDLIIEENTSVYKNSDKETKRKMIIKIGAYVFEVARRNFGGVYYWYERLDQPILVTGQPEFEMSLLAYEKVKNRFENGYEDNIPFFFSGYVQGVRNKMSQLVL